MSQKFRNFVFTSFKPEKRKEWLNLPKIQYIVIGLEKCPSTGRMHLQGYCELEEQLRMSSIKKLFDDSGIHIEQRRGTAKEAADYCKKDGDYLEAGTPKAQGKRTDLEEACQLILERKSMKEVANNNPSVYVKYHKGLQALKNVQFEHRTDKPTVHWRWGLAGTGKTRYCVDTHPCHYIKDGTQWWDGYEQQEAIIIDDFDGRWPYRDLLRLLDRYQYQGQTKGGYVKINSPFIYITCEYPPSEFWAGNELDQISRRIASVTKID